MSYSKFKWKIAQQLELKWWKKYTSKKDSNQYLNWKTNYWRTFMNNFPDGLFSENKRILEAGAGPAGFFILSEELTFHSYTAVDPLFNQYSKSLDIYDQKKWGSVKFEAIKYEDIKVKETYDVLLSFNAVNHFHQLEDSFAKFHKHLGDKGKLLISIDVHRFNLLKKIFQIIPGDALHPHQHSIDEYKSMIQHAGFKIIDIEILKRERIFDYYLIYAQKE